MLDIHKDSTCSCGFGPESIYRRGRVPVLSTTIVIHTLLYADVYIREDERVFYSYFVFFRSCFIFGWHESEKALLFNIRRGKSKKTIAVGGA